MKVTNVKYVLIDRENSAYPLARVTVILDGVLKLDGIKLCDGRGGKFLKYPEKAGIMNKRDENKRMIPGKHLNEWFHPIEKDFSDYLERVIIEGYRKAVERGSFTYFPDDNTVEVGDISAEKKER